MPHNLDEELEEEMVHDLCRRLEKECEAFRTKYIKLDGCPNCASIHTVNSLVAVIIQNLYPDDIPHVIRLLQEAMDENKTTIN